ncbi:MAG: MraY family glycosyltransferase [Planctomycetota bacterium]|nr:MraY family glycosyltransferase [Planctomycetota bacterium]
MIPKFNYPQIIIFVFAWFLADILTPVLIAVSPALGAVDKPHSYKIHKEPVSFLGGVGIYMAFAISLFSILRFTSIQSNMPLFGIIAGGLFVTILGILDDFRPISAIVKLIVLLSATYVLSRFGVIVDIFPQDLFVLNIILTLLWLVGVTSAMNSLDNMDGMAAGVAAIAAFFTFLIAWNNFRLSDTPNWRAYQRWVSYASIAVLGGCLGFLRYNISRARIFLGDSGSFLLGFLLASMAAMGGWSKNDPVRSFLVPCCILTVPLYDIVLSTVLRYKNGVVKSVGAAITYCGRDHLVHRLMALGFTQWEARLTVYFMAAVSGGVACYVSSLGTTRTQYLTVVAGSILLLVLLGVLLDKAPVYGDKRPAAGCDKPDGRPDVSA